MKTDENKLKTVAVTLRWEHRYRSGEYLTGEGAFLPELEVLDSDFAEGLKRFGIQGGSLLEIGAGLGLQAICYAQAGFDVTAVDVSATAMEHACTRAEGVAVDRGSLRFSADNILITQLDEIFDVVVDRGCYATLKKWELEDYCRNVHRLLRPGGLFMLKVNAGQNKMIVPLETRFQVLDTCDTHYHGGKRQGPPAVFFILKPLPL